MVMIIQNFRSSRENLELKQKDIDYIVGADHTYSDCELVLSKQIVAFLKQFV